jgi:hypothetical protein
LKGVKIRKEGRVSREEGRKVIKIYLADMQKHRATQKQMSGGRFKQRNLLTLNNNARVSPWPFAFYFYQKRGPRVLSVKKGWLGRTPRGRS